MSRNLNGRSFDDITVVDTTADNNNFVLSDSDSRATSQNENTLTDKNFNRNNAEATIVRSGNAVVNVTVDAETVSKNRNRAIADDVEDRPRNKC